GAGPGNVYRRRNPHHHPTAPPNPGGSGVPGGKFRYQLHRAAARSGKFEKVVWRPIQQTKRFGTILVVSLPGREPHRLVCDEVPGLVEKAVTGEDRVASRAAAAGRRPATRRANPGMQS